jgi:meiotic recombination protein SPO11
LNIPTFCLVDFDPDGIGIMSTYKYGSMALSHEDQNLTVPSMGWLGVQSADIIPTIHSKKVGLLKLSGRDRRTASRLIDREALREGAGVEWRRELQVMLMLNCKAEIQILSSGDPGLEGWLDRKLVGTLGDRLT